MTEEKQFDLEHELENPSGKVTVPAPNKDDEFAIIELEDISDAAYEEIYETFDSMEEDITNEEIDLYKKVSDEFQYKNIAPIINRKYHNKQKEVIHYIDNNQQKNSLVITNGRRWGKSVLIGDIATGELIKPFSSVLLLTPTYVNAQNLFNTVIKNIKMTGIKIESQNTNQFTFKLENGSTFTATSQKTVKNVLGSRISMLIVDETQDVVNLIDLVEQFIEPAQMDYGVKENGTPYARSIFIGTPRGIGTEFHDLFIREKEDMYPNWRSFNYPSSTNPLLSKAFLAMKKRTLPDYVYLMEYEAKWLSVTMNAVYFAFDEELNLFDYADIARFITKDSTIFAGLDIGFQDSTSELLVWVNEKGDFYIIDAYQANKRSTKLHVQEMLAMESKYPVEPFARFIDPSAAQSAHDMVTDHEFSTYPAKNAVTEGISCVNQLLSPTPERPPQLYIRRDLLELIRQVQTLSWKDKQTKTFKKDPKGTHYDLALASLRYAVYSFYQQNNMGEIISL